MSLDYDTTAIKNRPEVFPPDEQGKMNDTLHVLIWNALAIDVGAITENNVDEVWWRTDFWQKVIGPQFRTYVAPPPYKVVVNSDGSGNLEPTTEADGTWEPFFLTREDIVNAIGLATNVSTSTRHQFVKKVTGRFHA